MPLSNMEKEKAYALLGRALAFASEFEYNCRILAHLDDYLRTKDTDWEGYLAKTLNSKDNGCVDFIDINSILKSGALNNKIKLISIKQNICEIIANEINEARISRNFLVHEIPLEHRILLETSDGRSSFRAKVIVHMGKIINGNQIILDMINVIKKESKYYENNFGSNRMEYIFAVYNWLDGN